MVAFAGVLAPLAADLQRGEAGRLADRLGGHLIDGDAGAEVGAVGLPRVAAGQKAGHGAGVVAPAVAEGPRRVQGQAAQDEEVVLDRAQRFEDRRQLEAGAERSRRPVGHVDAVGDVEERHAQRRALRDRPMPARSDRGPHRFQPGQCDRHAQASQDRPPRDLSRISHGLPR